MFLFSNQESEIPEFFKAVILIFSQLIIMAHCWSILHDFHVQEWDKKSNLSSMDTPTKTVG